MPLRDNTAMEEELKTYRGNCHCGAFIYEVDLPALEEYWDCNCSLCYKKGYAWAIPSHPDKFRVVKGDEEALTEYAWNRSVARHKFCGNCGSSILRRMSGVPDNFQLAINARTMQDVDLWSMSVKQFDGKSVPLVLSHKPAVAYDGALPTAEIEGGKIYTGSCHCGAIQIALKSKPLDNTFPEGFPQGVGECNCSICMRNAYVWVWTTKDQVVLQAKEEDLGLYSFGQKTMEKLFCNKCGVHVSNRVAPKTAEEIDSMNEHQKKWRDMSLHMHPVTLRVFADQVDLNDLKVARLTQGRALPPVYINP